MRRRIEVLAIVAACIFAGRGGAQQQTPAPALTGPGVVKLDSIADKFAPVVFDHAKHLKTGECATCHHQHPAGALKSCDGCHTMSADTFKQSISTNSFKACKTCHAIRPAADKPGLATLQVAYHRQCFSCHRQAVHGDPEGCTAMCHTPPAAIKH